jgi:hypothetical protein
VDLFKETIVPMLELTGTSLLAIRYCPLCRLDASSSSSLHPSPLPSTPHDEFNYYSKLVEQKDENGRPFFKTIRAGRICEECGRLPYEQMIKCDHVPDGAHWKSSYKLKRLKTLFEGDEARGLRELGGIIASDFTSCFQKTDIENLFLNPLRSTGAMPRCVYIAVDPNGGGMSKMGVTAGYKDGNDTVVSVSFVWGGVGYACVCAREGGVVYYAARPCGWSGGTDQPG